MHKERRTGEKRVREKKLLFILLATMFIAFFATSIPTKASPPPLDHVRMYIWNGYITDTESFDYLRPTPTGSNTFPWKPYGTLPAAQTTIYVIMDTPDAWDNTAEGVVAYTVSLQVDPDQVEVMSAIQIPDLGSWGVPNNFLGIFLIANEYYPTYGISPAPATVDKAAGTITGFAEGITGYLALGKGAGDGPWVLMAFKIRTKSGVTEGGSLLTLFAGQYFTPDGVIHDVTDYGNGVYGTPPIPEFPLGIGVLMAIAPLIPIVYIWRLRKRSR